MSTFERTAIFCKEGGLRRRLPYELVTFDGQTYFSFAPMSLNPMGEMSLGDTFIPMDDYFYDDDVLRPEFDKINFEVQVDSELIFLDQRDGVSGYYDSNPSGEFGYPR
jgi:hypothetical protein